MIISSQGFGHFVKGINNQDFGIESSRAILILDGCSGAPYAEVGTKMFAQILKTKEGWDNVEKFEDKVKETFDEIVQMFKPYYKEEKDMKQFMMDNMLFTIIALFKEKEQFIVKLFGDGYMITENANGRISYLKCYYGKEPPYYAYNYIHKGYQKTIKTFTFNKKIFPQVVIATDGVAPFEKGMLKNQDKNIIECKENLLKMAIQSERKSFFDDITIGGFTKESKPSENKNEEPVILTEKNQTSAEKLEILTGEPKYLEETPEILIEESEDLAEKISKMVKENDERKTKL